jgi:hypothetical protein
MVGQGCHLEAGVCVCENQRRSVAFEGRSGGNGKPGGVQPERLEAGSCSRGQMSSIYRNRTQHRRVGNFSPPKISRWLV